jgi:hypothetical protein
MSHRLPDVLMLPRPLKLELGRASARVSLCRRKFYAADLLMYPNRLPSFDIHHEAPSVTGKTALKTGSLESRLPRF